MRTMAYLLSTALLSIAGAAAADDRCESRVVETLQQPANATRGAPVLGRYAASCEKYWSAANVLERAYNQNPTVEARFNLAAVYARTGRPEAAAELYRSVVVDGEYSLLTPDRNPRNPGARLITVNAADEARRRLGLLEPLITMRRQSASVVFAAGDAATDVSAIVGARSPVASAVAGAHLPDSRALQLDGLAQ